MDLLKTCKSGCCLGINLDNGVLYSGTLVKYFRGRGLVMKCKTSKSAGSRLIYINESAVKDVRIISEVNNVLENARAGSVDQNEVDCPSDRNDVHPLRTGESTTAYGRGLFHYLSDEYPSARWETDESITVTNGLTVTPPYLIDNVQGEGPNHTPDGPLSRVREAVDHYRRKNPLPSLNS